MKLARIQKSDWPPVVGILRQDQVLLTTACDPLELLDMVEPEMTGETISWIPLLNGDDPVYRLLAPIDPPEVWAYGFTYKRGPQFGRSPVIPSGPAYTAAVQAGRPEIFFKTTGFRVVGPNADVGIRGDSDYAAVEAELCLVLDREGRPVFFTAGNDVSAWDIEAANPLWLAQGKTFQACCALGPILVTRDELPENARVRCRVLRDEQILFDDSVPLADMHWSFEELAAYARLYNPLPRGTVLMSGTAVIRPDDEPLREGDVVEVYIDGIGVLRNTGRRIEPGVSPERYGFRSLLSS